MASKSVICMDEVEFYFDFFEHKIGKSEIAEIVANNPPESVFPILSGLCTEAKSKAPAEARVEPEEEAKTSKLTIDLHGFNKTSAEQYVRRVLMGLDARVAYEVVFIVGQGHHSEGKSVIPGVVRSALQYFGFKTKLSDRGNSGQIVVKVSAQENGDCGHHYLSSVNQRFAGNMKRVPV